MVFTRLPLFPAATPHLASLSVDDRIFYWIAELNKQVGIKVSELSAFIQTGGGTPLPSVTNGNTVIYTVPAEHTGNDSYINPAIAGKDFTLRLEGRPLIKQIYDSNGDPTVTGAQYEVLSSGGFHLLNGDQFTESQIYDLTLTSAGATTPTGTATTSLFTGVFQADTNTFLDASHQNKLISIRNGSTVTLRDLSETPDNSLVVLEAAINNTTQPAVKTKSGQFIYMNNQAFTLIPIGLGEAIWMFKKPDGYYVINDFGARYQMVGDIRPGYKAGLNELILNGNIVSRAQWARLWAWAQTIPNSIVSESTWQTSEGYDNAGNLVERPYRGCFSYGTDDGNFRLPDLQDQFIRGVNPFAGDQRYHNHPGGGQDGMIESHFHDLDIDAGDTSQGAIGTGKFTTGSEASEPSFPQYKTKSVGGIETRPVNVGLHWIIKT